LLQAHNFPEAQRLFFLRMQPGSAKTSILNEGVTVGTEVPLYWVCYGERASAPLLVLHGGPGAQHDYLLPQMLGLQDEYRLVFYDQRGGGRSPDHSRELITWKSHTRDLAAVIDELHLVPPTIIGYSWGALLAMSYAVESSGAAEGVSRPQPISRLVLISPAPATRVWRSAMEAEFTARQGSDQVAERRKQLADSGLRERDPDGYRKAMFELSVAGYFHDPARAAELTPFRVVGRVQSSVWESLGDYDILEALRALNIPALVVHGRDDPIPLQSSLEIAEALGARFLLLEKCGHVPYVEQPQALFSAIKSFLRDVQT
jgi:proline iminopeptidase